MSIVKKNTYIIGDNTTVSNLVSNVMQYSFDRTYITYSAPNILIKVGSLIECNGSLYAVETSDVSLTASVGNLCFNSNTLTFSISSSAFSYDPAKRGDYVDANTIVCRWRIGHGGQYLRRDLSNELQNLRKNVHYRANVANGISGTWQDILNCVPKIDDICIATGKALFLHLYAPLPTYFLAIDRIKRGSGDSIILLGWGIEDFNSVRTYKYASITVNGTTEFNSPNGSSKQYSINALKIKEVN